MFYTYNQNNSGGSFQIDDRVAHFVIIEANTSADANNRAEDVGIYFDGVNSGSDCECCGDRWYPAWRDDGDKTPLIYGEDPQSYQENFARDGEPYCHVYLLDGTQKTYRVHRPKAKRIAKK